MNHNHKVIYNDLTEYDSFSYHSIYESDDDDDEDDYDIFDDNDDDDMLYILL